MGFNWILSLYLKVLLLSSSGSQAPLFHISWDTYTSLCKSCMHKVVVTWNISTDFRHLIEAETFTSRGFLRSYRLTLMGFRLSLKQPAFWPTSISTFTVFTASSNRYKIKRRMEPRRMKPRSRLLLNIQVSIQLPYYYY